LNTNSRVGLALSGGGVRAVVFHLGVLEWLATTAVWDRISQVSTVSGGSLVVGLLFARNNFVWPSQSRLLPLIDGIRDIICAQDLQKTFIANHFIRPQLATSGRAALLADALRRCWGIDFTLSDLPGTPIWRINTTCYETGRNWIFCKREMGDYVAGYFDNPLVSVQTAIASSAAVPVAIGPMKIALPSVEPRDLGYRKPPGANNLRSRQFVTLWDGGVYENLGVEPLFRMSDLSAEIDFLLVSDASAPLSVQIGRWSHRPPFYRPLLRFADVATEQGRSYRVRSFMSFLTKNSDRGAFIKIGNSPAYIFAQAKKEVPAGYPTDIDSTIQNIWLLETTLRKLSHEEFSDLRSHGFWTAKATFEAWLSPACYTSFAK